MPFRREAGKIFWTQGTDAWEVLVGDPSDHRDYYDEDGDWVSSDLTSVAPWQDQAAFVTELSSALWPPSVAGADQQHDADHDQDEADHEAAGDDGDEGEDAQQDQQNAE